MPKPLQLQGAHFAFLLPGGFGVGVSQVVAPWKTPLEVNGVAGVGDVRPSFVRQPGLNPFQFPI